MILGWAPKKSSQDEKRIRFDLEIPLTDDNRDGILPAWLIDPLCSMERDGSAEVDTYLSTVLDGLSLEFWATDKSPERMLLVTSATLRDFSLRRVTRDSKTFIALCCNTNVKRDWKVLRFADQHEDCYVWIEFTATEPNLPPTPDANQMELGAEAAEVEQTGDEAASNLKEFKNESKGDKDQVSKAIKESSDLNAAHLAKGSKAKDESTRRPRGF